MFARRLQEDKRAGGIDREIHHRIARRPVVRGLRCGMNDHGDVAAIGLEQAFHGAFVTDVGIRMPIAGNAIFKFLTNPRRTRFVAEENAAHVIIDTNNGKAFSCKKTGGFRTRHSGSSCHQCHTHSIISLRVI